MDISRYSRGKVYKIVNTVDDKIYVGSTCLSLTKRLSNHKAMAKTRPLPAHIHFNELGWENVRIILVESVNAQNKDQLLQREQHYIDLLSPSLNKQSAYANCPHGREHNRCKECCGASICPHNKRKSRCKECGGSQICIHNRIKLECKECGGSQICSHSKRKSHCKECGGSRICIHNKQKSQCKDCLDDKYFCPECEKSFSSKCVLDKHLNSKKHRDNYNQMFEDCFN